MAGYTQLDSGLHIINADPRYGRPALLEPTTLGYILIEATMQEHHMPLVLPNTERAKLVGQLKEIGRRLALVEGVVDVSVFQALVVPPTSNFFTYMKEHEATIRQANFDIIVCIQTSSPERAREIESHAEYLTLLDAISRNTRDFTTIRAH